MPRSALAFWCDRPWPIVCLAIAIAAACTPTYCAVGYLHYKHVAVDEALAAQRAERANIDLQDALDRLRDELVASRARIDTLENEPTRRIAATEQYKVDRIAQMTLMLEQVPLDLQLTDPRPRRSELDSTGDQPISPAGMSSNRTHRAASIRARRSSSG